MDTLPVIFDTISTDSKHTLAVITLNDPKSLNALSTTMCRLMSEELTQWMRDDTVVAIVLTSRGDKAFCAGGNIRDMYHSMVRHNTATHGSTNAQSIINPDAAEFFTIEYQLYRQMYYFPKPIILWGDGIIMGGGMGLMAMCSHRVVTETTRIAMPEISIGLYPDATGSWFLQRMPAKIGLFMGLTGARVNGTDALLLNLAEFAIPKAQEHHANPEQISTQLSGYELLIDALCRIDWHGISGTPSYNEHLGISTSNNLLPTRIVTPAHHQVSNVLSTLHRPQALPPSLVLPHWQRISHWMNAGSIIDINTRLRAVDLTDSALDPWLAEALRTYRAGCPVTAALTHRLFEQVAGMSLAQTLYLELNASLRCASNPDFQEGVRALLIDKDRQPKWSRTLADCDDDYINAHLQSLYPSNEHPFLSWLK